MKLQAWAKAQNLTVNDLRDRLQGLGLTPTPSDAGVRHWLRGTRMPSPETILAIEELTEGQVAFRDWVELRRKARRARRRQGSSIAAE